MNDLHSIFGKYRNVDCGENPVPQSHCGIILHCGITENTATGFGGKSHTAQFTLQYLAVDLSMSFKKIKNLKIFFKICKTINSFNFLSNQFEYEPTVNTVKLFYLATF